MFKWFMTKSIIAKVIIVTSTVVVVGGATAGAVIVPKAIETKKEEQRQEQLRREKEEDLANMSITLKRDEVSIPLNGVVQGITIDRYPDLEGAIPLKPGDELKKEELDKVLIDMFVENYIGGELTIDIDSNINESTTGDYPVIFKVTSEKGNIKTENAKITVYNYFRPGLYVKNDTITITKGTQIDIMQGVDFDSNLPKEEQGHIETEGTVDVNTVGTYTINYKYVPKYSEKETESNPVIRTYKVVEPLQIQQNSIYKLNSGTLIGSLNFSGNKFTLSMGEKNSGKSVSTGTYTQNNGAITLNVNYISDETDGVNTSETFKATVTNGGKSITLNYYGENLVFYL